MDIDFTGAFNTIQGWINDFIVLLPNLIVAILVFTAFFYLSKGTRHFILKVTEKRNRSRHVGFVFSRLVRGTILIVGTFIAMMILIPSIKAGQLVGALGVSSIAIGFAFKDILQNFLAGILILLTQPFKIGDWIIVDKYEGIVLNIETRATMMRTYDNYLVVIPNTELFTGTVTVVTALDVQRTQYDFTIRYGQDIDRAKEIIMDVMRTVEGVLPHPETDVVVVETAMDKIVIRSRWWTDVAPKDWLKVRDRIIGEASRRFDKEEFHLPQNERGQA